MRARSVAIGASVAVHAGLAGLLVAWRAQTTPLDAAALPMPAPTATPVPAPVPAPDDGVAIGFTTMSEAQYRALVAPPPTPAPAGPAPTAPARAPSSPGPGTAASLTIGTGGDLVLPGGGVAGPAGGGDRGSAPGAGRGRVGPLDLRVRRDSALAVGAPVADAAATLEPHDLRPVGGGYLESDEGVFVARVAPDGTVTFHDRANVQVHLKVPTPRSIARGLADWAHDPYARIREGACDPNDPTPAEACRVRTSDADDKPDHGGGVPIIAGSFDATDAIMRAAGQDPYAARKLAMLDRTRAVREQMALAHQRKTLAASGTAMRAALARLATATLTDDARRDRLFALWDSCLEDGSDDERAAGRAARAEVIGWIRAHAPAGSAAGFTAAQLAAYNARRASTAAFAPYE